MPKICFGVRGRPPYFIYSTLPQRLAQIRHIKLDYVEGWRQEHHQKRCKNPDPYAVKCNECNLCQWLVCIAKYMTGLRTVDISMKFMEPRTKAVSFDDDWVVALLDLQRKSKAVREFEIIWALCTLRKDQASRLRGFEKAMQGRLLEIKQSPAPQGEILEV